MGGAYGVQARSGQLTKIERPQNPVRSAAPRSIERRTPSITADHDAANLVAGLAHYVGNRHIAVGTVCGFEFGSYWQNASNQDNRSLARDSEVRMPTVSLNALLKILSKSSPQKAAEYGRYLTPGGYDFYWMLKEAVRARSVGGKDLAECSKAILKIDRTVEKKHNLGALASFDKWLTKQGAVEFFEGPVGSCSSPEEYLKIKLEPAFGYVWKGQRRIVHTWASQSITLPRSVAACGLYLLKDKLCVNEFVDCIPTILDLRRRELFVAELLPAVIGPTVASELAWADGFFKAVAKAA
jgi:hypothetical protein